MTSPSARPGPAAALRRLLAVLVAGLLAAPLTAAAPAAAAGERAAAATSGGTICVGLLVDATSVGGRRSTGCAKVPAGSNGIDVLEAAGHSVTTQDNGGFVCAIDGVPASGCSANDDSHYWAYWHRAAGAGSWTYSSEGAASYRPAAGSTDGWVYDNGSSRRPGTVGQLCPTAKQSHSAAPPPASRSATPRATGRPAQAGTRHVVLRSRTGRRQPSTSRSPSAAVRRTSARAGTPTASSRPHRSARRVRAGRPTSRRTPRGATTTAGPTAPPSSRAAAGTAVSRGGGGSGPWLVLAGLLALAALSAGAWWRSRRAGP